ncbi:signal transduction histidine kinase [Planotetraspora sp. GP83]
MQVPNRSLGTALKHAGKRGGRRRFTDRWAALSSLAVTGLPLPHGELSPETETLQLTVPVHVCVVEGIAVIVLAALVWKVTRRTRRLVKGIYTQLSEINDSDRHDHVSLPPGQDEIVQLTHSVNKTLDQCERERQFSSDVCHELRTPLAGLRLEVEEARLHPDHTDYDLLLSRVLGNLDRVEAIIADMLVLARTRSGQDADPELFDLAEVVKEVVSGRVDRLPVSVRLVSGVVVCGVREHLCRVLTNLLDNAQRHAGSAVEVEIIRGRDGFAELLVSDDGNGIPERDRERVFERFTRLEEGRRRDGKGTGLGLALVMDVARAHSGSIHVEDAHLGGARFVFRLPLAVPPRTDSLGGDFADE